MYKLHFIEVIVIALCSVCLAVWSPACSPRSEELRFDCHPDKNATKEMCTARNCCWSNPLSGSYNKGPACYFPVNYPGFKIIRSTVNSDRTIYWLYRIVDTQYIYNPINELKLEIINTGPDTARIKITDANDPSRFEVPFVLQPMEPYTGPVSFTHEIIGGKYVNTIENTIFGIRIKRKNGEIIFDSSIAPLIYSDQFLEISSALPSQYVYGLGEHRTQFQISANWRRLSFWTRDQATIRDDNLYGNHPFLLSFDKNNDAYGYFLLNANCMETKFTPMPAITYRTIGGIIDLFIFMGSNGDDVISQYWEVVGHPLMAPYWSLGYHLSRWGYGTLAKLQVIVDNMKKIDFPYDVQWTDIDALNGKRIFTYDMVNWKELPEFVQQLHRENKKYISINDPGIASDPKITDYETYKRGIEADVYVRWANNSGYLVGEVWPGLTVYPDWTHPNAQKWWSDELVLWNSTLPVDGLWIDMNEVSSFIYGSIDGCHEPLDNPAFVPEIFETHLWAKTICPSAVQHVSNQYNMHSLYAHTWAMLTYNGILEVHPNKRPFILTRASYSGSGKYTSKWGGDNFATFNDMYYSITDILNFNMFGFPQTGDDLCGFIFDTTPELCTRWHQIGMFYTFMRNHNIENATPNDPTAFPPLNQAIMKQTVIDRYELLPYMYTLLYRSSAYAQLTFFPLMFEYPSDKITHGIDTQFLLGKALMSAPVLLDQARQLNVYFPHKHNERWFEFPSGAPVQTSAPGTWKIMDAPLDKHWTFMRSGFIIPTHIITNQSQNAAENRNSKFRLYAAVGEDPNEEISGSLFWDDGESLLELNQFTYISFIGYDGMITINTVVSNYVDSSIMLQDIHIFGVSNVVRSVAVDNSNHDDYTYDAVLDKLIVNNINVEIGKDVVHMITWQY